MKFKVLMTTLLLTPWISLTSSGAEKLDMKKLSENFQELHRVQLETTRLLSLAQEPKEEAKDSLVFSLNQSTKNQFKLSPFLKMQRALESSLGVPLKKISSMKCDQYAVEISKDQQIVQIYETCLKNQKSFVAKVEMQGALAWKVSFIPSYWTDILGIGVAIFSQEVTCQVQQQNSTRKVQNFSCQNWVQGFSPTRVYKFKEYVYKKDQDPLIELRGELLDSYYPLRKVLLKVPLAGKITWQESELSPVVKATPVPTATPVPSPSPMKKPERAPAPLMAPPGYPAEGASEEQDDNVPSNQAPANNAVPISRDQNLEQLQPINEQQQLSEEQLLQQQQQQQLQYEEAHPQDPANSQQIRRRR